jgi:hypothetical protein
VIGPPIIASSLTRGTRSNLPNRTTGRPLTPSAPRYSRASAYAADRPIRKTAAASSTVKKSGIATRALIPRNSPPQPVCVSKLVISPSPLRHQQPPVTEPQSPIAQQGARPTTSRYPPSGRKPSPTDNGKPHPAPDHENPSSGPHEGTGTRVARSATPQKPDNLNSPNNAPGHASGTNRSGEKGHSAPVNSLVRSSAPSDSLSCPSSCVGSSASPVSPSARANHSQRPRPVRPSIRLWQSDEAFDDVVGCSPVSRDGSQPAATADVVNRCDSPWRHFDCGRHPATSDIRRNSKALPVVFGNRELLAGD